MDCIKYFFDSHALSVKSLGAVVGIHTNWGSSGGSLQMNIFILKGFCCIPPRILQPLSSTTGVAGEEGRCSIFPNINFFHSLKLI